KLTREQFYTIDVEYAREYAKLCKAAGVSHLSLLCAIGASKDSYLEALRFKAEAEQACVDQGFKRTSLYRPSVLMTPKNRYGLTDVMNQKIVPLFTWMLPSKYHEVKVEDLGKAIAKNAELHVDKYDEQQQPVVEYLHYTDFMDILKKAE